MERDQDNAFTVLAIDGGGMRGLYTASVLRALAGRFAVQRNIDHLDIGKGFDLIVGTSTGGILASGLAAGLPVGGIQALYRTFGPRIFTDPVPKSRGRLCLWLLRHRDRSGNSSGPLRTALLSAFGDETIGELYGRRAIGLCLPATSLLDHSPRVFKTPHLERRDRDDNLSVVDACLATSAAPLYLPIASVNPNQLADEFYVDGGLWANSSILVGLLEGLALAHPEQPLTIISIGTCPPVAGTAPVSRLDAGVLQWLNRMLILNLGMNAQAVAARNMSNLLAHQLDRLGKEVRIVRCHESSPSADQSGLLQLDSATADSISLMETMGTSDAQAMFRWCQPPNTKEGQLLQAVFDRMPALETSNTLGERNEGL
ncbi:MAG: CBASS cGAMP-activated phospholipase [Spirochaetaceae bacterium]|nr:CBASS cGAMP-activated phospholipase [Spirochaetaceae bacterium]